MPGGIYMKWFTVKLLCFAALVSILGLSHATPQRAEDVFRPSVAVIDANTLMLEWDIKPGYFLYQDRIHVEESKLSNFHFGDLNFPKPLMKTDRQGNHLKIYRDSLKLSVPVLGDTSGESLFTLQFQGCADNGFCYPKQSNQIKLAFNDQRELVDAAIEALPNSPSLTGMMSAGNGHLHALFSSNNWFLILMTFFGFGLLLAFTPCVLPMIPVLSGIIIGQGKRVSTYRSFILSLSYVLSMALTYAFIGALVAKIGSNLQVVMQSPMVLASFSMVFVLLSLSMFGYYDLKLPNRWQVKLTKLSHHRASGGYVGAAIMGCLSTLILSPCVTAPLIGALGYIANTGDIFRGSLALFFMGLGMGAPLLIIGTSAGKLLPKTGHWMNAVKAFFGILLLGVAILLLSRIIPPGVTMILWASLLIFSGIFAGALARSTTRQAKIQQSFGIIALIYGVLVLVGASLGNQDPLHPLNHLNATSPGNLQQSDTYLKTLPEVKQALVNAKGKPVIIDFYADWCASCQYIAKHTLKAPEVMAALQKVTLIRVDVTADNDESRALMNYFHVVAPPTFIFYNREGQEENDLRLFGEFSAETLLGTISKIQQLAG